MTIDELFYSGNFYLENIILSSGINNIDNIYYKSSDKSYNITTSTANYKYLPSDINSNSSNATFSVFTHTNATEADSLKLLKPGPSNPTLALTYTEIGIWESPAPTGGNAYSAMVFGMPTTSVGMPKTGNANYSGILTGVITGSTVYTLSGTTSLSANFATSTLQAILNPIETNPATGATQTLPPAYEAFTINPVIENFSSGSSKTIYSFGGMSTYGWFIGGTFYGPSGSEIGGTFIATGGLAAIGSFAAKETSSTPSATPASVTTPPPTPTPFPRIR